MGRESDKPQSEKEKNHCCCAIYAALWRNCMSADKDMLGVRVGHVGDYFGYEMGRFRPKIRDWGVAVPTTSLNEVEKNKIKVF